MKMLKVIIFILLITALWMSRDHLRPSTDHTTPELHLSGSYKAIEQWTWERSYPGTAIDPTKYMTAHRELIASSEQRSPGDDAWDFIGPYNVAGRTLCMAFHPEDPDVMFVGSAGGGLWKTLTSGKGENAWQEVRTGFPVLAVSSIAIDQAHPDTMYIGTGEVYSTYRNTAPGEVFRVTRGTYGLGVLRTYDGGQSWDQVDAATVEDLYGIQDIEIDPLDNNTIYTATTQGLKRSQDGGDTWQLLFNVPNAVDVEVVFSPKRKIFVTYGNLNFSDNSVPSGVYMSSDNGVTFTQITAGLPEVYSGKALITPSPSDPSTLYASIQHLSLSSFQDTTSHGLFRSTDGGSQWVRINNTNVAQFQGWYSHDVAVSPTNPEHIVHVGIDAWHSENGGDTLGIKTDWRLWTYGPLPNTGADGPPNYAHADMHAVYFHPQRAGEVYIATDGGIFVSEDGGLTYQSRNEGLHTTQFYAQMGSSATDSLLLITGAQDNSTYIRFEEDNWWRVIGGDGFSAYVHPDDNNIFYGSAQGLFLTRLDIAQDTIFEIAPPLSANDQPAFNGPYTIPASRPDMLYAGAQHLYRSDNRGDTWQDISGSPVDPGNFITHISVDPSNHEIVYVATTSNPYAASSTAKLLKSQNGGITWTQLTGLPDRVVREIAIDPNDALVIYAALSGFGSEHIYLSQDGGSSWSSRGSGLPDLPTNTVIVDPENSNDLYAGNDIGVYHSGDRGLSWTPLMEGLPEAIMVMDLDISPSNRKIRIASHGRGIYERPLVSEPTTSVRPIPSDIASQFSVFPNPVVQSSVLQFELTGPETVSWNIFDVDGNNLSSYVRRHIQGLQQISIGEDLSLLAAGTYLLTVRIGEGSHTLRLVKPTNE